MEQEINKPMSIYSDVLELLSESQIGAAKIVHDTPSPIDRMRGMMDGMPLMRDKYCRLLVSGETVMTDAEFERNTNLEAVRHAKGSALIAGLGIGLILKPFIEQCVTVTVVEKSPDVIRLVAPNYPTVNVIEADIREWLPPSGSFFHTIYFDIWSGFNEDIVKEGNRLVRRFRKFLAPDGWISHWPKHAMRACRRR